MTDHQTELLHHITQKIPQSLSARVLEAFEQYPRHQFIDRFSVDDEHWQQVRSHNLDLIYADTTLLLYKKDHYISTISQPSFVLRMLDLLDLQIGMKAFELGSGSGWNAALMGHLVGKTGKIMSYEIIPEMSAEAQRHVKLFDLPQVEIIQGDALQEVWELEEYDRGIFTAGSWDLPGIFFDVFKEGGKFLFVLKTTAGDLLLAMEKKGDYFDVFERIRCQFVPVTGPSAEGYHNNLSQLYYIDGPIKVYPQGTMHLGENVVVGKDMIFVLET